MADHEKRAFGASDRVSYPCLRGVSRWPSQCLIRITNSHEMFVEQKIYTGYLLDVIFITQLLNLL